MNARQEIEARGSAPYVYMDTIRRVHRSSGGHFFDPEAMRFFDSRLPAGGFMLPNGGATFVTSERFRGLYEPDGERLYTVRVMSPDGEVMNAPKDVETLLGLAFQQHKTSRAATARANDNAVRAWLTPERFASIVAQWPPDRPDGLIAATLGISRQRLTALRLRSVA